MIWCFVTMAFDVLCVSEATFFWLWSLPGLNGVPTYVIYPASATAAPDVLPELLTKSLVLDALKKDTK